MTHGEFAWLDDDELVAFCVTVVKGLSPRDALERLGADVTHLAWMSVAEATDQQPPSGGAQGGMVCATDAGDWTVVLEPDTRAAAAPEVLQRISRGTEAVSVSDSDRVGLFSFAADGVLLTSFDTCLPEQRHGADPDRLLHQMCRAGLLPQPAEGAEGGASSRQSAMQLVKEVTGVAISEDLLFGREVLTAWQG